MDVTISVDNKYSVIKACLSFSEKSLLISCKTDFYSAVLLNIPPLIKFPHCF